MEIIFKKNEQVKTVKSGQAFYLLWFLFFNVVGIIIAILRKQFKIAYLNTLLLQMLLAIPVLLIIEFSGNRNDFSIVLFVVFLLLIYSAYLILVLINKVNYITMNQYLNEGYKVMNEPSQELDLELKKAQNIKIPFWIIIK